MSKIIHVIWLILFAGGLLAACRPDTAVSPQPTQLSFPVNLVVQDDGAAKITAGLRNDGSEPFAGAESFNGSLIVRHAETGSLRARSELKTAEPLESGASAFPLGWEGDLSPGEYQMVWGASGYGVTVATFSVIEGGWTMLSLNVDGESSAPEPGQYGELQTYVDSAKQALAAQESIPLADIDLLRLESFAEVDGTYQVVLTVNGRSFEFHVSDEEALSVPAGTPLEPTPNDDETANSFDYIYDRTT